MKIMRYAVRDLRNAREVFKDVRIPERLWPEIKATFAAVTKLVPAGRRSPNLASCLVFHVVNKSMATPARFRIFRERLEDPEMRETAVAFLNDPAACWEDFLESCGNASARALLVDELDEILANHPAGEPLDGDAILERLRARAREIAQERGATRRGKRHRR